MMRKGRPAADEPAAPASASAAVPAPTSSSDPAPSSAPGPSPAPVPARAPRGRALRQRVAVVIPAKDESRRIAATVRSAKAIPHVDLVLVVDDGSEDDTQDVARAAGAVVVRHSHNRGKAAAMETGAQVVAMRDSPDRLPRILLFVDGDLGETAVNTAPLVPPVLEGHADLAIALLPPQPGAGGRGIVVGAARRAIASMTGWTPSQPLSGMRCLTRDAFEAATPLAHGWGVETGMTIDLLRQGFRVVEVPCDLRHRPSGSDLKGQLHRAAQYRDVQLAVNARRVRRVAGAVKDAVTPTPRTHR
ncbi:glycosyltransferase [Cellulomonas sp. HZM]|uniref:glycosyltransferase family 2 protein n=1 Tax=Cellulomonas sp. HZM TaxID=1454010 RepID=UPI00049306B9|nr:glycosyltransferase [Cellulomonas sp. HZM]